ncbi:MAG TPA: hypothetical protein VMQ76_00630 [Terracidiphilus sp.]|nr:hypothetical protein [Terracidiphilus sp.]
MTSNFAIISAVLGLAFAMLSAAFATFPTGKVHRVSRTKLGRGQYPSAPGVACALTASGSTMTLTFSSPVVVSGVIPVSVAGGPTFVSQSITNSTVVTQVWSAALATHAYTLAANAANVASFQGGKTIGESGTF